jgi:cytochrome c oxidase cbb3-type subunit 3
MSDSNDPQVAHTSGDGIEEYDNHLPNWWLYTLFGAVVFAGGYWFYYHVFEKGPSATQAWREEVAAIDARTGNAKPVSAAELVDMSKDAASVAEGKQLFTTTCVACHGPAGGGIVGPNLTDEFWIHGGAPEQIYNTVKNGVPVKGMAAWGPQLGANRVKAVVSYVLTLRNTNVAGGKAPQGEKYAATP